VGADAAGEDTTKVLARALGARDSRPRRRWSSRAPSGDVERARRRFAAQGVTDAVDLVATAGARDVPLPARIFAGTMAAGSAAIAAAYVGLAPRDAT
jgi:hypothetical protein